MSKRRLGNGEVTSWLRSKPDDMSVRVFHVHLVRPGIIPRRHPNLRSTGLILREQCIDVFHTDPHPRARRSLPSLAKIYFSSVAAHRSKELAPIRGSESKDTDVVLDSRAKVIHAQDGDRPFEPRLDVPSGLG